MMQPRMRRSRKTRLRSLAGREQFLRKWDLAAEAPRTSSISAAIRIEFSQACLRRLESRPNVPSAR